jgi:hypothetical protein
MYTVTIKKIINKEQYIVPLLEEYAECILI